MGMQKVTLPPSRHFPQDCSLQNFHLTNKKNKKRESHGNIQPFHPCPSVNNGIAHTRTILVVWFCTAIGCILVEGMAGGSLCAWLCAQEVQPGEERVVQWRGPYSICLVVQQFCPSIPVPNTSWWVDGWNKQAHDCQYLQSIELWQHGVFFIKHTSIAAGGALKTSSERQQQKQKKSLSHNPHRQTVGMLKFREASFFPNRPIQPTNIVS